MRWLLLPFLLSSCVIKERIRTEYRTLPPRVIEKVYLIIPKPPETPKMEPHPGEAYA